jgi:hypothetical protein
VQSEQQGEIDGLPQDLTDLHKDQEGAIPSGPTSYQVGDDLGLLYETQIFTLQWGRVKKVEGRGGGRGGLDGALMESIRIEFTARDIWELDRSLWTTITSEHMFIGVVLVRVESTRTCKEARVKVSSATHMVDVKRCLVDDSRVVNSR